jgi:hypothetical protein
MQNGFGLFGGETYNGGGRGRTTSGVLMDETRLLKER